MASGSYDRPMTHQGYLKMKYSSNSDYQSKPTKRKKKSLATKRSTVRIIDDDINVRNMVKPDSDDELYFGTKEEKPIIADVVDDRPLHMRSSEGHQSKWKVVGDTDNFNYDDKLSEDKIVDLRNNNKSAKDRQDGNKQKTLSGKRAGLSNAKEIKNELLELKRKNDRLIHNLSDDVSGKNAKTVFRDRSTGKIRDMEKELLEAQEEEEKKALKEAEKKAIYDQWSKGLTQRKEELEKIESDLHEMSKPLARYKDDSDLEQHLRNRERIDDPMLQEFRKKRKDEERANNPNYKEFPKYKGPPAPPNRFAIQPGYRWDGVDRSNGYESKIISRSANREALQEEMYRWSTQDM